MCRLLIYVQIIPILEAVSGSSISGARGHYCSTFFHVRYSCIAPWRCLPLSILRREMEYTHRVVSCQGQPRPSLSLLSARYEIGMLCDYRRRESCCRRNRARMIERWVPSLCCSSILSVLWSSECGALAAVACTMLNALSQTFSCLLVPGCSLCPRLSCGMRFRARKGSIGPAPKLTSRQRRLNSFFTDRSGKR